MLDSNIAPDARQARRILLASMVGTTIEFYDFYIYATAAVLESQTLAGAIEKRRRAPRKH